MRFYCEGTYKTARDQLITLLGDKWQQYAAFYPPADKLTTNDLAALTVDLNSIVESMNRSEKRGQLLTIFDQGKKIRELSTDSLTGLGTRDNFTELIKQETTESLHAKSYTVINIDINGQKHVNDSHGHNAGDQYLRTCGKAVITCLDEKDKAFRMGGDEILVILEITAQKARSLIKNSKGNIGETAAESDIMLQASNIIAQRILRRFQKLWDNQFGTVANFSYGTATISETAVQREIYEAMIGKSAGKGIDACDITDAVHKIADNRQYAQKQVSKDSGEYYKMLGISRPDKQELSRQ